MSLLNTFPPRQLKQKCTDFHFANISLYNWGLYVAECDCILLEHWGLSATNCWSGRVWEARETPPSDNASGCAGRQPQMLRGPDIMNAHCVFMSPLPGRCLVPYCPHHVLNSVWIVALQSPLTSPNSSRDRGQSRSLGLVFVVRWNVIPGWEKRGEVIMRHPPSAGCLFGQTGCLAAQAVEGILMYMTNDSLSPFSLSPDSFQFHSALAPPFLPCEILRFKMRESQLQRQLWNTCIFWHVDQRTERFLPWGFADELTSTEPAF